MKIIDFKVFQGKNIYSHRKCIRLNLDLEGYSEVPSKEISDFNDNLVSILPELKKHRCGIDEDMGFIKRLKEGTYLAHICEHIIIALHNTIGLDICYGKAREISGEKYYVIYEYSYKNTGIEAGNIAVEVINSLINKSAFNIEMRLNELREILMNEQPGLSTINICNEAKKRGIPVLRIGESSTFQLGYGKYSKLIQDTLDSDTKAIIADELFEDMSRHIPLVAVTGTNGKTTTTRLIGHILSISGYNVGMTTTGGIYINGKCIYKGDTTGPKSAITVLANKDVDAAVLETARGGIIREGLAYEVADVAVITNITEDHIGMDEVETIEDLAKVKALVGEEVKEGGYVVVNGDDYMSLSILHRLNSKLIVFSHYKENETMRGNMKHGGYGIYINEGYITIGQGIDSEKLIKVEDIGITLGGVLKYNIENAMAACGAAVALGLDSATIKLGLISFYNSEEQNPGRFNSYYVNGMRIILDYGHNIEGFKCVLEGISKMLHNRLIGIIGAPGDRTDSHILEMGKCAGNYFNNIYIREDKDRRGRRECEVADILEKGVLCTKFNVMNVKKILNEVEAFNAALDFGEPGDIIIIFFDNQTEPLINIIKKRTNESESNKKILAKI